MAQAKSKSRDEMTVRDHFAAAALQSIVRSKDRPYLEADDAEWAYRVANAMLVERERAAS